jgi:hypothetical protein
LKFFDGGLAFEKEEVSRKKTWTLLIFFEIEISRSVTVRVE